MKPSNSCIISIRLFPLNARFLRLGSFLVLNICVSWRISSLLGAVDIRSNTAQALKFLLRFESGQTSCQLVECKVQAL